MFSKARPTAGLLRPAVARKCVNDLYEARLARVDDDPESVRDSAHDFVEDFYLNRYGLPSLAEQHGVKFIGSIEKHARTSPSVGLFVRLCGLGDKAPFERPQPAFNLALYAMRAAVGLGCNVTDELEIDREKAELLLRATTLDAVADEVDIDGWFDELRQRKRSLRKSTRLRCVIGIQSALRGAMVL